MPRYSFNSYAKSRNKLESKTGPSPRSFTGDIFNCKNRVVGGYMRCCSRQI